MIANKPLAVVAKGLLLIMITFASFESTLRSKRGDPGWVGRALAPTAHNQHK
jgi:hypothetical protein